jgi:hypothetical protein
MSAFKRTFSHSDPDADADADEDADLTLDAEGFAEDLERLAEDSFIQTALSQGVDLRGYSHQIEQELRDVEVESVRDYVSQSEQVVELHNQMQSCDAILARMQEMLLGFQVMPPLQFLLLWSPRLFRAAALTFLSFIYSLRMLPRRLTSGAYRTR